MAFRLHGQTETADRKVTVKEEELMYLATINAVILNMLLRRRVVVSFLLRFSTERISCVKC